MDIFTLGMKCFAKRRQLMKYRPASAAFALDKSPLQQTITECPKCLVRIEGQLRKAVLRAAGIAIDFPQRVPLDEADTKRRQCLVQLSMMTIL